MAGWGISPPAASSPSAFRAHYMMPGHRNPFWCCSVTKSCQTLSHVTPWTAACLASLSFTVAQSLLGFMSIESVMPSTPYYPSVARFSSYPQSFPASGSFPMFSWLFPSGGQSIGASASASVLPMNIQGWFPLGWTGWIPSPSKGLSRVFSRAIVWSKWEPGTWLNLAHGFLSQVPGQWLGPMGWVIPGLGISPRGEGRFGIRMNNAHRASWWPVGHPPLS